jgi:O-antigen/teichoic acid export membrane protein
VSATALVPVLLGFGVANNLGREAARSRPDKISSRLLHYFLFLTLFYVAIYGLVNLLFPGEAGAIALLSALLFLEHIQTDMFAIMSVAGHPFGASLVFFIRSAGWALIYMPLAIAERDLRQLNIMGLFWLGGNVLATIFAAALTWRWRWLDAVKALPKAKMSLPHKHGSMALYLNDVSNTTFVYVDRYIIGIFLSPEALGVYTFFWSIVNATSNLISNSFIQTRRGELLQIARASPLAAFNRALGKLAISSGLMTSGFGVLIIALIHITIQHMKRPELLSATSILYILCSSLVFRMVYEVIGISFYAHSRDDITLYSGLAILVISLALNFALVPIAGIWGAGVASLASYVIGVAARGFIISRGFRLAH